MPLVCSAGVVRETCPTVDQLRSGLASEWEIKASEDKLDNLSFKSAQITHSSFSCEPFIRCVYQRNDGRQVFADKDDSMHTPYEVNHNLWMSRYDGHDNLLYHECSASLESCSWDNETGCHGAPSFPM
jgi:hypothetical protein